MTRLSAPLQRHLVSMLCVLATTAAFGDDCTFLVPKGYPVDDYAAAVTYYRRGRFDTAGERLLSLDSKRIDEVLEFLSEFGWSDDCFLAASMLHTEVGMATILREPSERHFEAAWNLANLVLSYHKSARFQRDWLLLAGLFHQKMMFDPDTFASQQTEVLSLIHLFRAAEKYFDDAVELFPEDTEILVAAGSFFEWAGAPNFGEPRHLAKAERLYLRATRVDPDDPIAELRYGIVLWKRGRSELSRIPLGRTLELATDDELAFRAHMALGRIDNLQDRHEAAISHFRAAVALKPDWQIGALALSNALHLNGARDEAREILAHALQVRWTDENLFGWWSYEVGLSARFEPLLEKMRAEVISR